MTDSSTASRMTSTASGTTTGLDAERRDLLAALQTHRDLFKRTTIGMSDEQAARRSTVSALSLGGLVKHVAQMEDEWARFIVEGPSALGGAWESVDWSVGPPPELVAEYEAGFAMQPGETLAGLIERYDAIAATTDALVGTADLDAAHPLPAAPWFEPGARWSARRVLLHLIAETAQHAGHADIIRESIDGAKTMG